MCKWLKIVFVFLLLFFVSCGHEEMRQTIPFAHVNFRIDTSVGGRDHALRNPLTYKIFMENDRRTPTDRMGFGGLLIVSGFDNEIFAFDLACPFERNPNIRVVPNSNGEAVCSSCGSVFITSFGLGTVRSGVARAPLQRYRVYRQESGVFLVRN